MKFSFYIQAQSTMNSKMNIKISFISDPKLSQDTRADNVIYVGRRIQMTLRDLKCGRNINVDNKLMYEKVPVTGDTFDVSTQNCLVIEKSNGKCEKDFKALGFKNKIDDRDSYFDDFTVCRKNDDSSDRAGAASK